MPRHVRETAPSPRYSGERMGVGCARAKPVAEPSLSRFYAARSLGPGVRISVFAVTDFLGGIDPKPQN